MRRTPMTLARYRLPPVGFLARGALALALTLAAGGYLATRFRLGLDDQASRCLPPYRLFLIDRHDRAVTQGDLVAFAAQGAQMGPWFADGTTVVKRVAAVPGDRVQVTVGPAPAVRVNGARVGEGLALAATLQRAPQEFARDAIVPGEQLWVMGDTPDSFDSRYWGFLPQHRVIGRAHALW
jgi:conjugal transfer pilin signal peptidase TrbI